MLALMGIEKAHKKSIDRGYRCLRLLLAMIRLILRA